jgi:hypothetical protein
MGLLSVMAEGSRCSFHIFSSRSQVPFSENGELKSWILLTVKTLLLVLRRAWCFLTTVFEHFKLITTFIFSYEISAVVFV